MNLRSLHLRVLALLAVALLAGCATPARVERMQVDPSLAQRTTAAASPLKGKVAIKDVTGGSETNPAWMSKVSSGDFERALEASLQAAGLWRPIARPDLTPWWPTCSRSINRSSAPA